MSDWKDPMVEAYKRHVDRTLLRENLKRSVDERVRNLQALLKLADEARRAGECARGVRETPSQEPAAR